MQSIGWHDLATATQGRLQPARAWGNSPRICTDSREVQRGDIFWCLTGPHHDGHAFAAAAVAAGAALVVCRADAATTIPGPLLIVDDPLTALGRLAGWHRRRHEALVIGVTGSVGKTTTKELIYQALSGQFAGLRNTGSYNNLIGLPKTLLELTLDHEFAVCELGASREGDIRALAAIATPEIGVITAIGPAHYASFGSLDAILRGKGELFEALPETGFAVLPGDDPVLRPLADRARCPVIWAGTQPEHSLFASDVDFRSDSTTFQVEGQAFQLPFTGRGLFSNALCAIAVAREIGVPLDVIADSLAEFQLLPGRGAVRHLGGCTVLDDTYNASPLSMRAACERLAAQPVTGSRKRLAVLGDMKELGALAAVEHRRLGELIASLPIQGLLTYGEHARDVADGAIRQGFNRGCIVATESLDVLLTMLDCWIEPADLVLVKGSRAMRMEQVLEWLEQRGPSPPQEQRLRSA